MLLRACEPAVAQGVLVARSRRFDDADQVIEYAELIARADTRFEYRYEYPPPSP